MLCTIPLLPLLLYSPPNFGALPANAQPNPIVKTLALPDLAVSVIEISASGEETIPHGL